VNPTIVVVHKVQGDHVAVVLKLLAESIGQPRETAHPHSHREIAAFYKRCADVVWIRIASENASAASDAGLYRDSGLSFDAP
jgi:hypothetical protein